MARWFEDEGRDGRQRTSTHRRPPGLRDVHLRRIIDLVRYADIVGLEELPGPCRGVIDADVAEPGVHVGHLGRLSSVSTDSHIHDG